MFCSKCGKEISEGSIFCKHCGDKVFYEEVVKEQPVEQPEIEEPVIEEPVKEKLVEENHSSDVVNKDKSKRIKLFIGGGLLAVLVVALTIFLLTQWQKNVSDNDGLQAKEESISLSSNSQDDSEMSDDEPQNNISINVKQVDISNFPEIILYVEGTDIATGNIIELNNLDMIKLKQLNKGTISILDVKEFGKLDREDKLNVCLVSDVSGSMYEEIDNVKMNLCKFVDCLQYDVGDKAAFITFDSYVYMNSEFTSESNNLKSIVNSIGAGNSTALYDALYVAVGETAKQNGAKCVIAFTDGYDNASSKASEEVINYANQYKIPIYIVGMGEDIDENILINIADSTKGTYQNISNSEDIEALFLEIYNKNKDLYYLKYNSSNSVILQKQLEEIELFYDDGTLVGHSKYEFSPFDLNNKIEDYLTIVNNNALPFDQIEAEVLRIRGIYNQIVASSDTGEYQLKQIKEGVQVYCDANGEVRRIVVKQNGDMAYTRYYYFENGLLVFAYLEGQDSHRLYFYNEKLFRWRYAIDAQEFSDAENHDREDSDQFRYWANYALNEAKTLYKEVK